mgnify:CR=1 FL=1
MTIQILDSINSIKEASWNKLVHENDPFNDYHFHKALEDSNSIGQNKGFIPKYITITRGDELVAAMAYYVKMHSYGEYIFDWAWADFYKKYGYDYYPKVVAQNPYSPITNRTFLYSDKSILPQLTKAFLDISKSTHFSSSHILFLEKDEIGIIPDEFKIRSSFQYHWNNDGYESFDHFLSTLKNKKKKQIIKERSISGLQIKEIPKEELGKHTNTFYNFYLQTIDKKYSHAYLNEDFFTYLFKNMKENIVLFGAFNDKDDLVAAALYLKGKTKLYGRYWGSREKYKNLHFELCYYQGIEYCIRNKIEVFEAGAQGEHKIQRGFTPTIIYSAHLIQDQQFKIPIYNFIDEESEQIRELLPELSKKLPFKTS